MITGKLAAIMIGCTIAIAAVIAVAKPPQTTKDTEAYVLYVGGQVNKAMETVSTLLDLTEEPQPQSLTWTYEVTSCLEQLEQISAELTATRPPKSLYDKDPEKADAIYEEAVECLRHLTRGSYLRLDYANTADISYLTEYAGELVLGRACHMYLLMLLESIDW